jgi:DNA-binding NtrC family response regulator
MHRKLLVIDDQDSMTRIVSKIASDLGYQVRTLNDPASAFEEFEAFRPDVLVIDLVMPEVDGIDVLHKVLAAGTRTEVIVMSGYGKAYLKLGTDVAAFHDHPAIRTLAKPFRKADLIAMLTHTTLDAEAGAI